MNSPKLKTSTPDRIMDAAQQLILTEGFHGVAIDRIIETAGVSKGTFFYHFKSKEALATALLERFLQRQSAACRQVVESANASHSDPFAILETSLRNLSVLFHGMATTEMSPIDSCSRSGCLMASFSYQLFDEIPELKSLAERSLENWTQFFKPLFEQALQGGGNSDANGGAKGSVDYGALTKMAFALMQGTMVVSRSHLTWTDYDEQIELFIDYLRRLRTPG